MDKVVPKIAMVQAELDRHGLPAELEVDGGVDVGTAPIVVGAGAAVLMAGSAVFDQERPWEAAQRIRAARQAALEGWLRFGWRTPLSLATLQSLVAQETSERFAARSA